MQPFKPNGNTSVYSGVTFRPIKDALSRKYCFGSESDSRSFCRFTRNTFFRCSVCSTRSASRSITTPSGGRLSRRATQSASVRATMGTAKAETSSLRASLRAVGLDRGSPLPTRPPLHGRPVCPYQDIAEGSDVSHNTLSDIFRNMHDKLVGIAKRLDTDAPGGFLLSGGLDSSLVCVVSARLLKSRSARSPSARRATTLT